MIFFACLFKIAIFWTETFIYLIILRVPPGTRIRNFCLVVCPRISELIRGSQKIPWHLVLKGTKKICGVYGTAKPPLIYPHFQFSSQFWETIFRKKNTKNFSKPNIKTFCFYFIYNKQFFGKLASFFKNGAFAAQILSALRPEFGPKPPISGGIDLLVSVC